MGSFSIWHWLIVLVIVMLVFGTLAARCAASRTACAKATRRPRARRRSPARRSKAKSRASPSRRPERPSARCFTGACGRPLHLWARETLRKFRGRDGGDFRAGRDSGRRRVLDAHKADDGDAMRENHPVPPGGERGGRASKARGARRPRVAAGSPRRLAYDSAMTRASALLLGLAISTYRCRRAPSRRRVPAATRVRVTCGEFP
jgi:hypothetical protein